MSHATNTSGLMRGADEYIRGNVSVLRNLPRPDEEWRFAEVDDLGRGRLQKLWHLGIVEKVRRPVDEDVYVWQTDTRAWKLIEEYADREEPLLCDHPGIRNLGDGLYTCGRDECDHKYTRDTVELLFMNQTLD